MNPDFYVRWGPHHFLPMLITTVQLADNGVPGGLISVEMTLTAVSAGPPVDRPKDGIPVRKVSA